MDPVRNLALAVLLPLAGAPGCGLDEVPGPDDLQPVCRDNGPVLLLDIELDEGLRLLPRRGDRLRVAVLRYKPPVIGGQIYQAWSVDPCGADAVQLDFQGWPLQSDDELYSCRPDDTIVRLDASTGEPTVTLAEGTRCVAPRPGGDVFVRRVDDEALGVLSPEGDLTIWRDADGEAYNCGGAAQSEEVAGRTLAVLSGCGWAYMFDTDTGDLRLPPRPADHLNLSPDGEHAVVVEYIPPMFHGDWGGADARLVDLETSVEIHLGGDSYTSYRFFDDWLTHFGDDFAIRLSDMRRFEAPQQPRLYAAWPGDRISGSLYDEDRVEWAASWHPESGRVVTYAPDLEVKYLGPRGAWLVESVVDESPMTYVADDGETFPEILPTHRKTALLRDGSVLYVEPTSDRTGRLLHIRPGHDPLVVDEDVDRYWPRVHPGRPIHHDNGLDQNHGAYVEWGDDDDVLYQVRRDGRLQLWRVRLPTWDGEGDAR